MQPGATLIFLDANVLFSRTLRDWFCQISLSCGVEGIDLRWSEDVLAEFVYSLRRQDPGASDAEIGQWRANLHGAFPQAIVRGYEIDPSLLQGPDELDANVLAAALHGDVDYLVTNNSADFAPFAGSFNFEIFDSDSMLCLIAERRPDAVRRAYLKNMEYWARKERDKDLATALKDAGAPEFSKIIRELQAKLALTGRY